MGAHVFVRSIRRSRVQRVKNSHKSNHVFPAERKERAPAEKQRYVARESLDMPTTCGLSGSQMLVKPVSILIACSVVIIKKEKCHG